MTIETMFSALVEPKQSLSEIPVANLPLKGDIYKLLQDVLRKSPKECKTPIIFRSDSQTNQIRNYIIKILKNQNENDVRALFHNLSVVTPVPSGVGLCFLIIASDSEEKTILITRFPTEEAIRTRISHEEFKVELIKDIFIKSSKAYKAAIFSHKSLSSGFWKGSIVDKQISDSIKEVSEYWLYGFLQADFEITSKTGTDLLARGIKKAIQDEGDLSAKQQLLSMATLLSSMGTKKTSIRKLISDMSLGEKAKKAIARNLDNEAYFDSEFEFSKEEFVKNAVYKSVYLDNGSILTAETTTFEACFDKTVIDEKASISRYSTTGKEIDVKVKSRV